MPAMFLFFLYSTGRKRFPFVTTNFLEESASASDSLELLSSPSFCFSKKEFRCFKRRFSSSNALFFSFNFSFWSPSGQIDFASRSWIKRFGFSARSVKHAFVRSVKISWILCFSTYFRNSIFISFESCEDDKKKLF